MPGIIYYRKKCIGCGMCYEHQPGQWRMSRKDGKANLVGSTSNKKIYNKVSSVHLQHTHLVERSCPARAIKVIP